MAYNVFGLGDVALCCPACVGAGQYCLHAVSRRYFSKHNLEVDHDILSELSVRCVMYFSVY